MTGPENFISRWSRLKRESAKDRETAPAESALSPDAVATPASASPSFDPASLPPIESITIDTDIRAFLQSGVPTTLAQAALRRVWVSDPAIRDFIGIAENQWDFTDPTAIPGFGPLRETDDVPSLVAQAIGTLNKVPEAVSTKEALLATTDHRHDAVDERSRQRPGMLAAGPANPEFSGSAQESRKGGGVERNGPERLASAHGSALPR
jgi:hypothetical protein